MGQDPIFHFLEKTGDSISISIPFRCFFPCLFPEPGTRKLDIRSLSPCRHRDPDRRTAWFRCEREHFQKTQLVDDDIIGIWHIYIYYICIYIYIHTDTHTHVNQAWVFTHHLSSSHPWDFGSSALIQNSKFLFDYPLPGPTLASGVA